MIYFDTFAQSFMIQADNVSLENEYLPKKLEISSKSRLISSKILTNFWPRAPSIFLVVLEIWKIQLLRKTEYASVMKEKINYYSKVHSFCKQCLHKDRFFTNCQLMSALASLERFGEEDLVFINRKLCRHCFQNEWPLDRFLFLCEHKF